ncbi:P-loop containing nucleoside triphosphate hydrolase protein, partial [Trichoderma reesei RUT C-30]
LLRPFKLLVHYDDRIRHIHRQLERKFCDGKDGEEKLLSRDEENTDFLDQYGTEQAYKELGCLIEFMDHDLKSLTQLRDVTRNKVSFPDLWHIFFPGREVVTSQEPMNAYRVFHVTGGRPYLSPPEDDKDGKVADYTTAYRVPDKESDLVVTCYQVDFDGQRFGPVSHSFRIQKFDDLRDITTLTIYPLDFAKRQEKVQKKLKLNGQLFCRVCQGSHVQYRGMNLHEAEEIDSEVVVDFQAALWDPQNKDQNSGWDHSVEFGIKPTSSNQAEVVMISYAGCRSKHCCDNEVIFDDSIIDLRRMEDFLAEKAWLTTDPRYLHGNPDSIPKADLFLFPHRLFAFVLKDRKWAVIDINNVKDVPDPEQDAWNSLVLPEGHKHMVHSVVQAHFRDKKNVRSEDEIQTDLIRGKGKGLVILLHGAPGTGKTSTAECVAEICKRPLYPITCGDLGTTAVEVEGRLKRIFIQAQKWKCVLLLDEADVFLSERGNDVKHNSLVSVFLRILEYYQGILFLTTNRVGKMDEAFRSRVHVSLYYPPLNEQSTLDIFETNLQRIKTRKGELLKIKEEDIRKFAKAHYRDLEPHIRWNGRQIRNAFHIAVALAENEVTGMASNGERKKTPTLRKKHFRLVEDASTKFDEYLTDVIGVELSERARTKGYR